MNNVNFSASIQSEEIINGQYLPITISCNGKFDDTDKIEFKFTLEYEGQNDNPDEQSSKPDQIYRASHIRLLSDIKSNKTVSGDQTIWEYPLGIALSNEVFKKSAKPLITIRIKAIISLERPSTSFSDILRENIAIVNNPQKEWTFLVQGFLHPGVEVQIKNSDSERNFDGTILYLQMNHHSTQEIQKGELLLEPSQIQWEDGDIHREADTNVLNYVHISRSHFSQNEGFIEIKVDWAEMLKSTVSMPSRRNSIAMSLNKPELTFESPLYIRTQHALYLIPIRFSIAAINQLAAKIVEVARFNHQGKDFLALKIEAVNYSNQILQVNFIPPTQIFGTKFKAKVQEPLVVLGITLSMKEHLGTVMPNDSVYVLLRIQLINKGILNLTDLQFEVNNRILNCYVNFLHQYQ